MSVDFKWPKVKEVLKEMAVVLIGVPLFYLTMVIANLCYEAKRLYKRIVPWL